VWSPDDQVVAAGHRVDGGDLARWEQTIDRVMGGVAVVFSRVEPRRIGRDYVVGLLSETERKNCWWLAENAGHTRLEAMRRLLRTANWDAEKVREEVRLVVLGALAHPGGVLIVDEIGFLQKGTHSAGVQRQYTGTAGRMRERPSRGVVVLGLPTRAGAR
jgi:SRSO17 transposase